MSLLFVFILLINILMNMGMGLIIPILPHYLQQDGFSISGLSLPFSILVMGRFLSKYYTSYLVEYFGQRRLLLGCCVLYGIVFLLYPHFNSKFSFTTIRFLEGCIEGICGVCLNDLAIIFSQRNRGKLMGYFGASFGLGFILGPALGAIMYYYTNVTYMFYSGALLGLMGCFLTFFFPEIEKKNLLQNKKIVFTRAEYMSFLKAYGPSLLRRVLFFSFMILIPLYANQILHCDVSKIGLFFSGSAILTTILMPFTGRLADKIENRKIAYISLVIMSICLMLFGVFQNLYIFIVLFAIETIAFAFMLPAGMKIFADVVENHSERQYIISSLGSITEVMTFLLAIILPLFYMGNPLFSWGLLSFLCIATAMLL